MLSENICVLHHVLGHKLREADSVECMKGILLILRQISFHLILCLITHAVAVVFVSAQVNIFAIAVGPVVTMTRERFHCLHRRNVSGPWRPYPMSHPVVFLDIRHYTPG